MMKRFSLEVRGQASNNYILEGRIASGGMGTVYRAFDVSLKRYVALKVLHSLDPLSLERFVREREITADLDHPSFVRVLSTGYLAAPKGKRPFYTMPLIQGETLAAMISRRSSSCEASSGLRDKYSLPRLTQLMQHLCLAMESAHARHIIHCDLKPSNVLLGPYGELYIVDLGLAKYVDVDARKDSAQAEGGDRPESDGEDLTRLAPAGTPYFMAPEQVFAPEEVDFRADVFGLGAILYFSLTAHRPEYRPRPRGSLSLSSSVAKTMASAKARLTPARFRRMAKVLQEALIPPHELVPGRVDAVLSAICTKALSPAPEDRYASCRAMHADLQNFLIGCRGATARALWRAGDYPSLLERRSP